MQSKTRTSYPVVYDLEPVISISRLLLKASLPLWGFCDAGRISEDLREDFAAWRRKIGLNTEVVTLAGILGLVGRRKFSDKDCYVTVPGMRVKVGEVFGDSFKYPPVAFLTRRGIELAVSPSPPRILFDLILSNRILPPHFARAIESDELYNHATSLQELEEILHIPSKGKRPEAKCVIKWCQFLGINETDGMRIRLSKVRVVYLLLHSLKNELERLLERGQIKAFNECRQAILRELNLSPTFAFDDIFEILYKSQDIGVISFKAGRQRLAGGWKGKTEYTFISLTGELRVPSSEYIVAIVESRPHTARTPT